MGMFDGVRNAFGGGTPSRLPAQATTAQIDKYRKAKAKEAQASKDRVRRHRESLRKKR
ncbi:hypothetical protein [Streptomyces sp. NPDC047070]|uniref:hypothetical protein n=1 Tax=Streptomyces sp. NPDC047070 TaxID=3154923 RepID=UPI003452D039